MAYTGFFSSHRIGGEGGGGGVVVVTPPPPPPPKKKKKKKICKRCFSDPWGGGGGGGWTRPETLRTYAPTLHHTFQSPDLSPHTIHFTAYYSTWFTPHVQFMTCHSTCCSYITPTHPVTHAICKKYLNSILS